MQILDRKSGRYGHFFYGGLHQLSLTALYLETYHGAVGIYDSSTILSRFVYPSLSSKQICYQFVNSLMLSIFTCRFVHAKWTTVWWEGGSMAV